MLSVVTLLIFILVGLLMAFFATQNIAGVPLTLANYTLTGIPLYIIVIGSMLLGIVISGLISFTNSIFSSCSLHSKDRALRDAERVIETLQKEKQELAVENTSLKTEYKAPVMIKRENFDHEDHGEHADEAEHHSFFHKIRESFKV